MSRTRAGTVISTRDLSRRSRTRQVIRGPGAGARFARTPPKRRFTAFVSCVVIAAIALSPTPPCSHASPRIGRPGATRRCLGCRPGASVAGAVLLGDALVERAQLVARAVLPRGQRRLVVLDALAAHAHVGD